MGYMMIDGRKIEFTDEKNVLSVIRKAGINIPTLCYHSEVSTFGAVYYTHLTLPTTERV